jgi:hypothetical protein
MSYIPLLTEAAQNRQAGQRFPLSCLPMIVNAMPAAVHKEKRFIIPTPRH